jgi:hypothetical protein
MMPKGRKGVNASEREQSVGQVTVDILGGMKDCASRSNSWIQPKQAKVEYAPVPDESHDAKDGYYEDQYVKQAVDASGQTAREFADIRRQAGWWVPNAPPEPRQYQRPKDET